MYRTDTIASKHHTVRLKQTSAVRDSVIFCSPTLVRCRLHFTHLPKTSLKKTISLVFPLVYHCLLLAVDYFGIITGVFVYLPDSIRSKYSIKNGDISTVLDFAHTYPFYYYYLMRWSPPPFPQNPRPQSRTVLIS